MTEGFTPSWLADTQKRVADNTAKGRARRLGTSAMVAESVALGKMVGEPMRQAIVRRYQGIPLSPRATFVIKGEPMGAPRMTRRDKWLKPPRACVARYWEYRDAIRNQVGDVPTVPDGVSIRAFIPMPDSWSRAKKLMMAWAPHKQRPDADNLMKAVLDALFLEDGGVWSVAIEKRWCPAGEERLEINFLFT